MPASESATPRRPSRSFSKRVERIAFGAGLALLAWLLHRVGPGRVLANLSTIGWGFLPILLLQAGPILLNTLSWQLVLPRGRSVALRQLAPVLVAGDAVNAVSPVGLVGGEVLRATMLSRWMPAPLAVGATGLAAMSVFAAQVLFVLSGMPFALLRVANPRIRLGLTSLSGAGALALGIVVLLGWWPAALDRVLGAARRIPTLGARWKRIPRAWRQIVPQTLRTLRDHPTAFVRSVAASFFAWQVGVVETFVVLALLHRPVDLPTAVAIEVLAVTIEGALFFVPAKIGTQEGGRVLIFLALGLDPAAGLALGLVRRIRELFWAAIGLAALGRLQSIRFSRPQGRTEPPSSGLTVYVNRRRAP